MTSPDCGARATRNAGVTSTVSAALIDTRNGYVYGLTEATADATQLANAWTNRSAIDQSRRRAEREAFERMLDRFQGIWSGIVAAYARAEHAEHTGKCNDGKHNE